ncbi:MAG: PH domain-containing protein [Phycisphaeraceae bacterium]|nr:PH domain-containing protein [Phycisphaeraceae bacterium]MCW5762753.1 PH domain-containing protein [Phycisphaeraceae bacterium]
MTPHGETVRAKASRRTGRSVVPAGESILLDQRPSAWLIVFRAAPYIGLVAACLLFAVPLSSAASTLTPRPIDLASMLVIPATVMCIVILVVAVLDWLLRRYILTDRRAISVRGILHQTVADVPLKQIQNIGLSRPLAARLVGIGHIGLATAGSDGWDLTWTHTRRPHALIAQVRKAMDQTKA